MLGIGIDIGGTNTKLIVADKTGKIFRTLRFSTLPEKGVDSFIQRLSENVLKLKNEYGDEIKSIGIGSAGDVDPEKGVIRYSPNLDWRNVELTSHVTRLTSLYCVVENDANMAAWGAFATEFGKKKVNAFVITLGTGIGSGIILDGKLYHGSTGSAGEAGHLIIENNGRLCNCGKRGCLEAYCGSIGILKRAGEVIKDTNAFVKKYYAGGEFNTIALTKAALSGDKTAIKLFEDTGKYLGHGLSNMILLLNPEYIILTGGVSNAKELFLPSMLEVFKNQPISTPFESVKVKVSDNPELGSIGAALYGIETFEMK